jgi:hypothetical protein
MAQFNVVAPMPLGSPGLLGLIVNLIWLGADWSYRRRALQFRTPAYLAVTASAVHVFSARSGATTRIIGPTHSWPRSQIQPRPSPTNKFRLFVRWAADKPEAEIEAAEPGPESAKVVELLGGSKG